MHRAFFIFSCLLSAGCNRVSDAMKDMPPAAAYIHFDDKVAAQMLHWGILWRIPCTKTSKEGGVKVEQGLPDDQCVRFTPPMRLKGLWRNNFEGSHFCAAPATTCFEDGSRDRPQTATWLDFARALPGREDTPPGGLYAIEFIGRRSAYRGFYGHFGMSNEDVIVDRLISIKVVEPPAPGQMTKEHIEGYLKECGGAQICMPNTEIGNSK